MYSKSIQKLIDEFSKFPATGPRTAARFVFYLRKLPNKEVKNLIESIVNLKKSLKTCFFCFSAFEANKSEETLCEICQNRSRNKTILCLVEKETDLLSLEKTKKYKGLYFVLGGIISGSKKTNNKKLEVGKLISRIKNPAKFGISDCEFKEIILGLNPTNKGEIASMELQRVLKPLNKKITRLGRGLPLGGELEYADSETLENAIEGRK